MKFKRKFLFVFLVISLSACVGRSNTCNKVRLLNKEKVWYNFYSTGDSLVFGNSQHELAFVVKSKGQDFTPCNKFELGPNVYEYQGVLLKNDRFKITINFTKANQKHNEADCYKDIYVSDLYTDYLTDLEVLKKEDVLVPYLNKVESTYLITSDTLSVDIDGGMQIVKSFNWSKKYGVVRYTRFNGEVFDLLKKK